MRTVPDVVTKSPIPEPDRPKRAPSQQGRFASVFRTGLLTTGSVLYAGLLTAEPAAARSRVTWRRRVGSPSVGLATPQAAPLQISSL